MRKQGIRLSMGRKNDGFTLIELIVSLFLLTILTVLLMLILETTVKTSKRFMNYTDYEYALAHKKIFEIYNSSNVVDRFSNHIVMESKDNKEEVLLIFRGDRVFLEKKKNTNSYVGNILLLKKLLVKIRTYFVYFLICYPRILSYGYGQLCYVFHFFSVYHIEIP